MKTSIELKLGQQITMTPQLQQAIRLLQLSSLDLRQEILDAIESNPLLELDEDYSPMEVTGEPSSADAPDNDDTESSETIETDWENLTAEPSFGQSSNSYDSAWEDNRAIPSGLYEHLLWQLNLTPMSDADRSIAWVIIEALDDNGYLHTTIPDIRDTVRREWSHELPDPDFPEDDEVLAVLHRVQQFDPPGVAARDLTECLSIQLHQLPDDYPHKNKALTLVKEHLGLLEGRDATNALHRHLGVGETELAHILALIRGLNPNPGERMTAVAPEYLVPDIIVRRKGQGWMVELNPEILPKVSLNAAYSDLSGTAMTEDASHYLRTRTQEARWFLKSLQSRNETILKVAERIVTHQQDFLEYGDEAMKPLILADIATALGMHESTISRATNQKYMLTPKGTFELKHFFSSHVGTQSGGECSSTAIRAIIKKLVAGENPGKPLSDARLTSLLNDQGIQVARRTVAKYREAMRIPPSSERKQLSQARR